MTIFVGKNIFGRAIHSNNDRVPTSERAVCAADPPAVVAELNAGLAIRRMIVFTFQLPRRCGPSRDVMPVWGSDFQSPPEPGLRLQSRQSVFSRQPSKLFRIARYSHGSYYRWVVIARLSPAVEIVDQVVTRWAACKIVVVARQHVAI